LRPCLQIQRAVERAGYVAPVQQLLAQRGVARRTQHCIDQPRVGPGRIASRLRTAIGARMLPEELRMSATPLRQDTPALLRRTIQGTVF
jgi:hypothetical protein